ncbi:MAG: hypothetical protein JNM00_01825 [Flavobacteriales bacterium]|nr:hypothetical protein [Flavobacteriales bacterium]
MTIILRTLLACLLMSVLANCTPYKTLMSEGSVLENGGLTRDALEKYEEAWRQSGKAEARTSMRRMAQQILNQMLSQARMSYLAGNHARALDEYDAAFRFEAEHNDLEISSGPLAQDLYLECRSAHVDALYKEAEQALMNDNFDEAERIIDQLLRVDRSHQEAKYLSILCDVIPAYKSGELSMGLGQYRDAWIYFNEVCLIDPAYKDALKLRAQCAEKAKVVIAYVPIEGKTGKSQLSRNLSTAIKSSILGIKNPFLQLVERENLEQLLQEQLNGMNGTFSAEDAVAAGELVGARYLLTGELVDYNFNNGHTQEAEQKGFTATLKKVTYMQFRKVNKLEASYRYQIVDAQSGRIYAAETIPFTLTDEAKWAEFEGDPTGLIPGDWKWRLGGSEDDRLDYSKKDELKAQFGADKTPMSESEMQYKLIEEISRKIAHSVSVFQP